MWFISSWAILFVVIKLIKLGAKQEYEDTGKIDTESLS